MEKQGEDTQHTTNRERTVKCPVCDKEVLARGIHLHINQSVGDGHGAQGEVPDGVELDDLETVGEREVSYEYPKTQETEEVGRQCPYCKDVFRGKRGVMIHLGKSAGQGPHPAEGKCEFDPDKSPIVRIDETIEVVDTVADGSVLPSTRHRRTQSDDQGLKSRIQDVIDEFRQQGKVEEAVRLEEVLEGE